MEIEMKYSIRDKAVADALWEDAYLSEIADAESKETVYMKSAYFDTEDSILSQNDIAFRVRMEGSRVVACLKWNGTVENGLHIRDEINVPVDDPICFIQPHPSIFKESETGREVMALVGEKRLESLLEINFLRRRVRVDTGRSIMEVAVDTGEIVTDLGNVPICELEIELFSGENEDVVALGNVLAESYDLTPMDASKYSRGLNLIKSGADAK